VKEARTKLLGFIQRELAQGRSGIDVERESLVESGIIDSLGIMKLVDFIEKEFRVKIGDEDLVPENFETLDDITKLLAQKQ
jgi:acyl carrier protein